MQLTQRALAHMPCPMQARELTSDMPAADARSLGRTQLVRRIFRQLRSGGPPVPGFKWYMADAAVQVRPGLQLACMHTNSFGPSPWHPQ